MNKCFLLLGFSNDMTDADLRIAGKKQKKKHLSFEGPKKIDKFLISKPASN